MTDKFPRALLGIALVVFGGLFFAGMHASVRFISSELHPFEISFFRQFFAFLLFLPWIVRTGPVALRTRRPGLQAIRAAVQVVSLLTWFYALSIVPLAEATTLGFSATFFVAIAAGLFLGEAVGARRWTAVFVGFIGVVIVIRPGFIDPSPGVLLVLVSSVFVAASKAITKVLARSDSTPTIVMYTAILISPMALLPALFVWQWPSANQFLWLAAVAAQGTVGHLCLTQAYKLADISAVEPASLVRLIWAALIGMIAFAEFPDHWTILGATVIAGSVVYLALGERKAPEWRAGGAGCK